MFRISVLICISLLVNGFSAKPYKSWEKATKTSIQETLMSTDIEKPMSDLGLKQKEDMGLVDNDINPPIVTWKNIIEKGVERQAEIKLGLGRYSTAEEDRDHIYHPSMEQNLEDTFVREGIQIVPLEVDDSMYNPQHPEQDLDKLYHPDMTRGDWLYEANVPNHWELPGLGAEFMGNLEPEEDRDNIYHGDLAASFQGEGAGLEKQMMADWPSQRMHSQPEEDRDEKYHV
ncbi:hypothetical protein UPYG_G00320040 [Umbra pygmaea]|uniref:Uncharacterized protein n=1 Tax=Umbra pygmaea TaxID=75934 RepID=A0ABD0WKF1_UMBPY